MRKCLCFLFSALLLSGSIFASTEEAGEAGEAQRSKIALFKRGFPDTVAAAQVLKTFLGYKIYDLDSEDLGSIIENASEVAVLDGFALDDQEVLKYLRLAGKVTCFVSKEKMAILRKSGVAPEQTSEKERGKLDFVELNYSERSLFAVALIFAKKDIGSLGKGAAFLEESFLVRPSGVEASQESLSVRAFVRVAGLNQDTFLKIISTDPGGLEEILKEGGAYARKEACLLELYKNRAHSYTEGGFRLTIAEAPSGISNLALLLLNEADLVVIRIKTEDPLKDTVRYSVRSSSKEISALKLVEGLKAEFKSEKGGGDSSAAGVVLSAPSSKVYQFILKFLASCE